MTSYLYIPLLLLGLLQCQRETITEPEQPAGASIVTGGVKFGQEFTLQQFDQVTLYGGDTPRKLHLTAQQLTDSRCPANATCVHYGSAALVLSASNSQGKIDNIQLCIGACGTGGVRSTHSVTAAVGETAYRFSLVDVEPFPGLEKEGEAKVARLLVEKIGGDAS
ncbi:hypothetical protein GCM10023188_45060 [Pontibacter saemangeumensis]|uniref:Lipoprotein n=1 Tax=Pontibacter saemangeumensis TaxID=1084525 RepID=A0ABP8M6R9_9BACT